MEWDDLRFFLCAAREGSFSGAGRVLEKNHTTVARRVERLELRLGSRLFERSRAGLSLTSSGEEVLEIAARAEALFFEMERRVLGRDARLYGVLRVATVDVLAVVLSRTFAAFAEVNPEIELAIVTDVALHDLGKREADIALRITAEAPPDHLIGRKLTSVSYAGYFARSLLLEGLPLRWIVWGGARIQAQSSQWLRRRVEGVRISASASSGLVVASMVRAGMGAALLPCILGDADPELVRVLEGSPRLEMALWVLTHPDLKKTARVRVFVDHMVKAIPGLRSALSGDLSECDQRS